MERISFLKASLVIISAEHSQPASKEISDDLLMWHLPSRRPNSHLEASDYTGFLPPRNEQDLSCLKLTHSQAKSLSYLPTGLFNQYLFIFKS